MHNYYAEIVWAIDLVLIPIIALTCFVIFSCVLFMEHNWQKRRHSLLALKKNVYEMVLANNKEPGSAVCIPFISELTPQQYIDIETNRSIEAVFFNESEQKFFRSCFITPENINKLTDIVNKSRDKWKKIEAMLCLGYAQAESAIAILGGEVFSKDRDISYFSMISLGQIKTVESARILLDLLRKEPSGGYKIISLLEDFPKEITDDIVELTDYHDPIVQSWALTLLSKFVSKEHIKKLEKLTHNKSPEVRAAACDCLGNTETAEAGPALIACLRDDNWLVKNHAVYALSKTLKADAISHVIGLINDASWSVVDSVKDVMTRYIQASLPYIERFLANVEEVPKKYAVLALQNSGYLAKLLNDMVAGKASDPEVRLLKSVVKSRLHAGLDAQLYKMDPDMRAKALDILMKMEGT
jgi:hypothetical protein